VPCPHSIRTTRKRRTPLDVAAFVAGDLSSTTAMTVEDLDKAIAAAETELGDLEAQRAATVERLSALKKQRRDTPPAVRDAGGSSAEWSPTHKVELFRSLFRGREDVFAVRWENSAKQRSGYAPRCANEWKPGICGKPRVRCGACPNQAFLAASAAEVLAHLRGRQVVGIYPLLADDTCWLLAIDLDGERWQDDGGAVRQVCLELGLTPAVERSRSGAGAHLWFFFEWCLLVVRPPVHYCDVALGGWRGRPLSARRPSGVTKQKHPRTGTSGAKSVKAASTTATCFASPSTSLVRSRPAILNCLAEQWLSHLDPAAIALGIDDVDTRCGNSEMVDVGPATRHPPVMQYGNVWTASS
jgi:hypothetical protein